MSLKTITLCSLALLLVAASDPKAGKLKTIFSTHYGDTMTYKYDASGRISQITSDRGYRSLYQYTDRMITEKTAGGSTIIMYLNSRGYVDSLVDVDLERTTAVSYDSMGLPSVIQRGGVHRVFSYSGQHLLSFDGVGINPNGMTVMSKKFTYDAEGFVLAEREYTTGKLQFTADNVIARGNLRSYLVRNLLTDTVTTTDPVTGKKEQKVIQYNPDSVSLEYLPGSVNSLRGNNFFGASSKELVSRKVSYYLPFSGDSAVTTFQYTFDKQNRVTTLIKTVRSTDPPEFSSDAQELDTCRFTYY